MPTIKRGRPNKFQSYTALSKTSYVQIVNFLLEMVTEKTHPIQMQSTVWHVTCLNQTRLPTADRANSLHTTSNRTLPERNSAISQSLLCILPEIRQPSRHPIRHTQHQKTQTSLTRLLDWSIPARKNMRANMRATTKLMLMKFLSNSK